MTRFIYTTAWIIGISLFLLLLSYGSPTSSLLDYQSIYLNFSYPGNWQINDDKNSNLNFLTTVGKIQETLPYEAFWDNENLIKFNFPAQWLVRQDNFPGQEIRSNIYLVSPDNKNVCLIQVWKIDRPLADFIQDIKNAPASGEKIEKFSVNPKNLKGKEGFLVEYLYQGLCCKEFYFLNQDNMYRIAYLYSGVQWTKEQENNFQIILKSIVVKE